MQKLKLGVAGLGRGFTLMLPTFRRDPRVALVAAADARVEARTRFASDFSAKAYESVEALCDDPDIDVVYVATPHQFHAEHATVAAKAGKHVLVEKPMAISLDQCATMIKAARDAGVHLLVGHSHSFNAPILRARALIDSGDYGEPRLVTALNYTDFVYRPRRPEELVTARGGGVVFSQGAHQVDIVRLLAGSRVTSVRSVVSAWDRTRPMDGAYTTFLAFENGAAASLTYSGYGNFDSDEFHNWIGEMGDRKEPARAGPLTFDNSADESALKQARNYGGANFRESNTEPHAHQNFGTVIVSCERADLRPLPTGVMIYRNGEGRLDPLPAPKVPRAEVIDELYDAVVNDIAPRHSGEWAMATLAVCLAMLQSARENHEVKVETA